MRELADVTLTSSSLEEIVVFKQLSALLMRRIKRNYTRIVTLNTGLILLGMFGILPASTTSLIHNGSTFVFAMSSATSLLENWCIAPILGLFYFLGKEHMSTQVYMMVGGGNCILGLHL